MSRPLISFLIWLAAAVAAGLIWFYTHGPREPFPGLAGQPPTGVAATETGRLVDLAVKVGDVVVAGAVVARLDAAETNALVEVARAELVAALADVEAEAARGTDERRQAEMDLLARTTQARAAIDDALARRKATQAEFRSLSGALDRIKAIDQAGLARGDQVAGMESRRARLQGEASYGPEAVQAWQAFSERLDQALAVVAEGTPDAYLAPFRARVDLARRQVDAAMTARGACDLTAPRAGRVSRILLLPGSVVLAGAPILELVEVDGADLVVAWLPEERSRLLDVGTEVGVRSQDLKSEPVVGRVEAVAPGLEILPERLWADSNVPRYGRQVRIRVATAFFPGEAVQVAP